MLILEQFLQRVARRGFTFVRFRFRHPLAFGEFKIFAKISNGFFKNRFGAEFAALLRHARIVVCTIQAHAQIRAAFHARLAATRISR
jgi:hypothetical protein